MDPERVVVATVAHDRDRYLDEVEHLFRSLDLLGGDMRRAARRVYFVGDAPSAQSARRVRAVGADVRVRPEVHPGFRFANKLAMFAGEAGGDAELLVAVDSDVVVTGDFSRFLVPDLLQASSRTGTCSRWRCGSGCSPTSGCGYRPSDTRRASSPAGPTRTSTPA